MTADYRGTTTDWPFPIGDYPLAAVDGLRDKSHLQPMAGGLKKRRKRTIEGETSIGDVPLLWELASEPQWSNSGDGYKGLCISVRVAGEARRELIIEYPYPTDRDGRPAPVPQRPDVTPKLVEASIRLAMDAGWDPTSRGKAFVFHPSNGS